jgi:hypothetical protein
MEGTQAGRQCRSSLFRQAKIRTRDAVIRSRQLGGLSYKNAPDFEMAAPHTFKGIEIALDALPLTAK